VIDAERIDVVFVESPGAVRIRHLELINIDPIAIDIYQKKDAFFILRPVNRLMSHCKNLKSVELPYTVGQELVQDCWVSKLYRGIRGYQQLCISRKLCAPRVYFANVAAKSIWDAFVESNSDQITFHNHGAQIAEAVESIEYINLQDETIIPLAVVVLRIYDLLFEHRARALADPEGAHEDGYIPDEYNDLVRNYEAMKNGGPRLPLRKRPSDIRIAGSKWALQLISMAMCEAKGLIVASGWLD